MCLRLSVLMAAPLLNMAGSMMCIVCFLCLLLPSAFGAKLNAPKVLLPYYSYVVANFTLEVEYSPEELRVANCYRWRSTRPEVAQVHLINSTDGECASKARVSAISKTPHQMTTVVLAENRVTKEVLRCNVIVSEIHHLEIETTTRLLFLEDSPEELIARGYDSEGNVFSSLEGLVFDWNLVSDSDVEGDVVDAHNILRIKRFAESHYTTPHHILPLEEQGLQGDTILVEGIRTGSAKCSTRLKDPFYKSLVPSDVRIVVIANLIVSPPDAYVLKLAQIKYTVELLRHNALKEIPMPSPQYYLDVIQKEIGTMDPQTSIATGLQLGSTEIVLKDRNIVMTEIFRQPSAMLHVVNPGFLAFVVLPYKKWVLETGREYEIYIEIYDTDSRKIYPSDNVRVKAGFASEYFDVLFSSLNGTYHRVQTLQKGETIIDGALVSVIDSSGDQVAIVPQIKGSQDVEIYDPITVEPSYALFPWDPVTRCQHSFTARARGGSGEYIWGSSDVSRAAVNYQGQITTSGPGKTNITAADTKNPAHAGSLTVHVLPPSGMNFPPTKVEAAIGTMLLLPLVVFAKVGGRKFEFTDCTPLPLNVTFSDSAIFSYVQEREGKAVGKGCTTLHLKALQQGHTDVLVQYQAEQVLLQASITIAAYTPLTPVDPKQEALVAIASSKNIIFQGGPQPWVVDSSKFFHTLSGEKMDLISIQPASGGAVGRGLHSFHVLCRDVGEQILTVNVGNGQTAKNQFPVTETTSVKLVCSRPVELHLHPVIRQDPSLPPCPVTHEKHLAMPVHCDKDLRLQVTVTDSSGHRFDNFSSLALEWTVSDSGLASVLHPEQLLADHEPSDLDPQSVRVYQILRPKGKTGNVVVTAVVAGYRARYLKAASLALPEKISPRISKSLEILLAEEAVLSPDSVSIFNHPFNNVTINVKSGSGYFYLGELKSQVIRASYVAMSRAVMVHPVKDGSQSFTIYDICLDVTTHPTATVFVSGVGSVEVSVIDKVEVGKEMRAVVRVLDANGHPLLSSFFPLMGLKLEPASDIVRLRPLVGDSADLVSAMYVVHGVVVGHTSLGASVQLPSGQLIYSVPRPLEVFPPLRLEPKNITLMIGARFQVIAVGGPQPQSTVHYTVDEGRITSVSASGLLEALTLGMTRLVGSAVGVDSITGETVVYSQDYAIINVVALKGIRIFAPLTRLQTGTRMPMYAVGVTEHEVPFSFGASTPPLTFSWSVNSREVLHVESVYHGKGIRLSPENSFSQQAVAKEAGHAVVTLTVQSSHSSQQQILTSPLRDEVQIQVFEKLQLTSPKLCDGLIRMTPNTETIIRTNRDVAALMSYTVVSQSLEDATMVQVTKNGQLVSGPALGEAVVHITAQEEFGVNQTLVFLVKVKPVSYLMLNLDTALRTTGGSPLSAIPVGSTLQFSVSYHDDVGETFYATNIQLGIRCSRNDLLHVFNGPTNNSLVVRAAEVGMTILKVWDRRSPWVADYISLAVAPALTPAMPIVTLGSTLCFNTPLLTDSGERGKWRSDGRTVVVDAKSGVAEATAIGHAVVVYSISDEFITYTEVTVVPVEQIEVGQTEKYVTTHAEMQPLFIPVTFTAAGSLTGHNCSSKVEDKTQRYKQPILPFRCDLRLTNQHADVSVQDIFEAQAVYSDALGKHGCWLQSVSTSEVRLHVASLESSLELLVTLPYLEGQQELRSGTVMFDLLPAFHVHSVELHLTTLSPLGSIRITTLSKVLESMQVKASDPLLLEVLTPEVDPQSGAVVYPVRLRDTLTLWEREQLDLFVELSSPKTGQRQKLPVLVKLLGPKPDIPRLGQARPDIGWGYLLRSTLNNYQSWLILSLIIVATAASVVVGYHALIGPRYKASATSNVFLNQTGQSSLSSPVSPHPFLAPSSGSPKSPGHGSPTTPHLWSVNYGQQTTPFRRSPYASFS